MELTGYIQDIQADHITIVAPCTDYQRLLRQGITECEVRLDDGRRISADQRKKIYATLRDIGDYTFHTTEELKDHFKADFIAKTGGPWFSLRDVDMTTAREFLEHLIEFCVEWDIPTKDSLLDRSPDVARYVYCCLMNKKCCISGKKAELHHVDAVGMGRDRREIVHLGYRVIPLSRQYHTEAHTIGQKSFEEKYHVFGIKLTKELCRLWRVKG